MPANKKKDELRSVLEGKTVEELEMLLALDFAEQDDVIPDVDYIRMILEVIEEKEGDIEETQAEEDAAWRDFQEYYYLRKQEEALEAGETEERSHDHHCKTEYGQRSRKLSRLLRYGIVAAVLVVVLCGTAFGWNIFQAIADWTVETFHFLTGEEDEESFGAEVFDYLRVIVAEETDVPVIPNWAPEGTEQAGNLADEERKDRHRIQMSFSIREREFTICIIVHDTIPDNFSGTYQKNVEIEETYTAGGVVHYIMGNTETLSAMWTNNHVEGYIQGALTLEEMQQMIDSIYEE